MVTLSCDIIIVTLQVILLQAVTTCVTLSCDIIIVTLQLGHSPAGKNNMRDPAVM